MRLVLLTLLVAGCGAGTPDTAADAAAQGQDATPTSDAAVAADLPPLVETPTCGDWLQGGHDGAHSGLSCASGQSLTRILADFTFDPFTVDERAENGGEITAHYQAPIVIGNDVFMEFKSGLYLPCDPPGSRQPAPCGNDALFVQTWTEKRLHWDGGTLRAIWTFTSDYKPPPMRQWEPLFQPVAVRDSLFVPAAGGTIDEVSLRDGSWLARVNPFGRRVDADYHVASGLSADTAGNVYYTVIHLIHPGGGAIDIDESWLVRVSPAGLPTILPFSSLARGAPAAQDACTLVYGNDVPLPWPPPPDANGDIPKAPTAPCGVQRAAMNATPAIAADGTLFVVSRAQHNPAYGYVIALSSDMTFRWATSLRGLLHDGCGVIVPRDDAPNHCRSSAPLGIDPATGELPAALVDDSSSSAPVALPGGGVLYGALTAYNDLRGHLIALDGAGALVGNHDFGWDSTPAVRPHDGTYSIILKDNHYAQDDQHVPLGPFTITQLSAHLAPEWRLASSNTLTCSRDSSGAVACRDDGRHPHGFEWCVNSIAVDQRGVVYAGSEDGNVYAIGPDGSEREHLFLDQALGAAYTPVALGRDGIIYALNNGHLQAVGN